MGHFIYQAAMQLFATVFKAAAPFNKKIKKGVEGRENVLADLNTYFSNNTKNKPVAWFHAASLGEFEQGRPVMEAFKAAYPDHILLLTFFSPSGYEIRKNYSGADFICYLPIDTQANARAFVSVVKPKIAFFIKYEFWLNYLIELETIGAYTISFSSIFRPGQVFFKSYRKVYKSMLEKIDHLFVQNAQSVELLRKIGISQCSIAGDTRFDRVMQIVQNARELPEIASFKNSQICLVAGSVWEADMEVIIPAVNALDKDLKVIIAPHEIKSEEIERWRKDLKIKSIRYSELVVEGSIDQYQCLIVDNIGMLSSLYKYGDFAYIGGAFGVGLHNILEAATFGLPVVFGNKSFQRFQEAVDLVASGGAFPVADTESALGVFKSFVFDEKNRLQAGKVAAGYVASGVGATDLIMKKVSAVLR